MTPKRFYELKNEMEELRNFDLELSNKVAAQDKIKSLEASCERTSHKYIVEQYLVQIEALQQFINQQQ